MAVPSLTLVNGCKIPLVGYGTFTITDDKDLETSLNAALETGYRHIDTAEMYNNEHLIGRVLKKWFDSGKLKREDLFVTTKLPPAGLHPEKVEEHLTQSLKQLQLDYVDLYLIHFPIRLESGKDLFSANALPTDHIAVWKKLEELVDLGKTKSIGVSNFNKEQVSRILKNARIKPASNQIELHVFLQQSELVKYLQDNGIVPVSYFSLGNPGLNDYMKKRGITLRNAGTELLDDAVVNQIAAKHRKSAGQILLKFLVQKNIAVIPKSVNPKRIKENFELFDFILEDNDIKALEGLDKGEDGRRSAMDFNQSFIDHPEYPFPKVLRNA